MELIIQKRMFIRITYRDENNQVKFTSVQCGEGKIYSRDYLIKRLQPKFGQVHFVSGPDYRDPNKCVYVFGNGNGKIVVTTSMEKLQKREYTAMKVELKRGEIIKRRKSYSSVHKFAPT